MARACLTCQQGKIHRHIHVQPQHIPLPFRHFSHLHIDLVCPLPASEGFTHLFTVIDRTTRWAEAIPLQSTSVAACVCALFHGWIARFGVQAVMTSDWGAQFTSSLLGNRYPARAEDSIPPGGQWPGQVVPLPPQGHPTCLLRRPPPPGHAGSVVSCT